MFPLFATASLLALLCTGLEIVAVSAFQQDVPHATSRQSKQDRAEGSLFDEVVGSMELSRAEQQALGLQRRSSALRDPSAAPKSAETDPALLPLVPAIPSGKRAAVPNVGRSADAYRLGLTDDPQSTSSAMDDPDLGLEESTPLLPSSIESNVAGSDVTGREARPHLARQGETNSTADASPRSESVWTTPETLVARLQAIGQSPAAREWSEKTRNSIEALELIESFTDPVLEQSLAQLQTHLDETDAVMEEVIREGNVELAASILRARYEANQVQAIASAAFALSKSEADRPLNISDSSQPILRPVGYSKLPAVDLEAAWQNYLRLDDLAQAWSPTQTSEQVRRDAARQTLARLASPVLNPEQKLFLKSQLSAEFLDTLVEAAQDEIHLPELFAHLAEYHSGRSGYAAAKIAEEYQNLLWRVDDPQAQALANEIDIHYRNANFRMSISDRMLNSLLPPEQEIQEPVRDNVLGASVSGQSRIANRLQLRLIPDSSRIQMRLESIGLIRSDTEASRSGFTVQNVGNTRFHVFRRFAIGQNGIETDRANAVSDSSNRVVGIGSNLDPIPVVGYLARRLAQKQIEAQEPLTKQIVENKLESTVKARFEDQMDQQLVEMQTYLYRNLTEPLTMLELEPTPVEMRSTDSRMVMRYRLAGRDQLAAHTTRPAGRDNCLMSMQIHESAINNMLNRLEINGNRFTIDSLKEHLASVLSLDNLESDVDLEAIEANLQFAPYDPIRVKFADGEIHIEFNLRRLQIGDGKVWKNLTASAAYRPVVEGTQLRLEQNGKGVRVSGYRLGARDQIAVRGIFTGLFQDHYDLQLLPATIVEKLPAHLSTSQFEVVEGWLGISFEDRPASATTATEWNDAVDYHSSQLPDTGRYK